MTTNAITKAAILARIADTRYHVAQAALHGAALRGEFGPARQILAMSEQYKALKAAGRTEEAAAVKAAAVAINDALKQEA